MEPMLHQMPRTQRGGLFHPKLWALRFRETEGEALSYRLLILSRNLTLDDSWDVAVRLDSRGLADGPRAANEPLASLVRDLPLGVLHRLDDERVHRVRGLAADLSKVHWELPDGVEAVEFHRGGRGIPPSLKTHGRVLIISPFITDDIASFVSPNAGARTVVSRKESLDQLSPDALAQLAATYILDPSAELLHQDDSEGEQLDQPTRPLGRTLHAKAYIVDHTKQWTKSSLILGSANATAPGFTINEELLVEFLGRRDLFGINATLGRHEDGRPLDTHGSTLGAFLASYSTDGGVSPSAEEREDHEFERRLLAIGEIPHTVRIVASEDEHHDVSLTSQEPYPLPDGWRATLRLLTRGAELRRAGPDKPVDLRFDAIPTADLTAYVIVTLTAPNGHERSATIVADLKGAPRDRWDHVLARQIDTPAKFMRYMLLLLSLDQPNLLAQLARTDTPAGSGFGGEGAFGAPGLLELVLRNLRHRPSTILDLDKLMRRLRKTEEGRSRIPPEVARLWPQIIKAARARKETA
ncbi:phospholipase D family protein [Tessaracoccus sp. MC1756]|uniref:phospholipase D family protein n=1 Tax=Tessaracoccus sp. MC1756 TaxID=2760311 RepID=UPI001600F6F5|nr:phospholipase D family protein [Tessaracoccus sp. MC1756]MBB1510283.1 phospholipase D family protein [Tessaracoccus sp. MC1756]